MSPSTKKKREYKPKQIKSHKFFSPFSLFEHYPLDSDYDNTKSIPYPWREMEYLLDVRTYINHLQVHKTALPARKSQHQPNNISRNVLMKQAAKSGTDLTDLTNDELYQLIKPTNPKTEKESYKYSFDTCNEITRQLPSYRVPTTSATGPVLKGQLSVFLQDDIFVEYNNSLCKTFILIGIISQYLHESKSSDYFILVKGGKAIQLLLNKMGSSEPYASDDIDIAIVSKKGIAYNREYAETMALHVARLLAWLQPGTSIKAKDAASEYSTVVKLYGCDNLPICDIDYGEPKGRFFSYDSLEHNDVNGLYIYINREMTLLEKCYYFAKAFDDKNAFYKEKFKKAIVRLANDPSDAKSHLQMASNRSAVKEYADYLYNL